MTQLTNNLPPVTEWFDGKTTVPGQPGFYQRDWDTLQGGTEYPDYWSGLYWYYNDGATGEPARNQDRNWRGLTEEVKS